MNLKNKLVAISTAALISISTGAFAKTQLVPVSFNENGTDSMRVAASNGVVDSLRALYGVGFEAAEDPGYTPGFFDNAVAGWQQYTNDNPDTMTNSTIMPVISSLNPASGTQHLSLDDDPAYATGTSMGTIFVLPEAPNLTDKNVFSVDIAVSLDQGADYHFEGRQRVGGTTLRTWWIDVGYQGNIRLIIGDHDGDTFLDNIATGTMWATGPYFNLRMETDPMAGALGTMTLFVNDVVAYTGDLNELGGVVVDHILIYSDNWQSAGEIGDVDNVFFDSESSSDLSLTKSNDTTGPVALNDSVDYTLTVDNLGSSPQTNVVLTDTMPAGMTYVSSSCDDTTSGSFSAPDVTFNLQDMLPGATTVCTVTATVGDYGTHVNNASVTSDADEDALNNDDSSSVTGPAEVDLSIVKTSDAAGQLATNATLVYTLTVTNTDGTDTANNVVVTDVLPAQATYVSNDCGAGEAAGTLTWNLGALAAGANAACNVTTTVTGFGTFDNTADVVGDEDDSDMLNNTSTVSVDGPVAVSGVDVAITKTSDALAALAANDPVVYTLAISNLDATNTANNVVVSDILPTGVAYVSNTCGASVAGGSVTWNAGSLAPGANASCDISATMAGFGFINNTATVTSDEADNDSTNNSSTTTIEGPAAVDLSLGKSVSAPDPLFVGTNIVYTLTAANVNTGDATGVVVSDTLPAQVSYLSNTCGASQAGGVVTWNIGNMNAGTVLACNISVTVVGEGAINNTASIASNESDVSAANNSSSAGVFVGTPVIIPTLNWIGMLMLILTMGFFGRKLIKQ